MNGTAPTPGQLKDLNLHYLKVLPANPADLAGTMWEQHLKDATVSHEALRTLIGLSPAEALLRLRSTPALPFPVWRTVQLGTYKTASALRKAVQRGNQISDWAKQLLEKTTVAESPTQIELYRATVTELGFPGGAKFADIRAKIHELGFADCPAEVGPQLRRQYTDQPMNEWVRIMLDPITGSCGRLGVFLVGRFGGGLWLYGDFAGPGFFYFGGFVWVFARK
jgi:hypothetical protein